MAKTKVFISYDFDNDKTLYEFHDRASKAARFTIRGI